MKKFRTLLIITALSFFSCSDNTVETVSQPEQELLRQLSDSVNTVVNKMFNSLATFADSTAKEKTINETKIRTMFTKWCLDFPEVVDCAFVTPLGIMQYIEPAA